MARPNKQGIDYFPLDTKLENDDNLSMIIGQFGYKGEFIFIKLLCFIYDQGYYSNWTEQEQLKFAKRVSYIGNPSVNLINEVVAACIKWGLFNKAVFESCQVLTSKRIQSTWVEATRKRKENDILPKIWLLGVNDGKKAEETIKKAEETTQSKVNKSKENNYVEKADVVATFLNGNQNIDGHYELESCKEMSVNFEPFVAEVARTFVPIQNIPGWLDAFNRFLRFQGKTHRQIPDYRRHFINWLTKIPNYITANPADYSPGKAAPQKETVKDDPFSQFFKKKG